MSAFKFTPEGVDESADRATPKSDAEPATVGSQTSIFE
jgi:hypothetical protein